MWYGVQVIGTSEPGTTIDLRIANISMDIIGTATVDANGNWATNINLHQNVWNHIYAWSVDAAGNYTQQANYLAVYSDTTAPSVPSITYNGGSNTCSWKNNYNLTLTSSDATGILTYQADHNQDGTADRNIGSNFIPDNGYSTCTDRYRAVDIAGNESGWTEIQHIHMDTQAPSHTNWWWGEVTKDVARLYIQATDNVGISSVQCPTSTQSGSYGNWYWFQGVWDSSANAYRCDITPSTFGHYGQTYQTHLYINDHAGNGGYYNQTTVGIPAINYTATNSSYAAIESCDTSHCDCSCGHMQGVGHCNWHVSNGESVSWRRICSYSCPNGGTLSNTTCVLYTCPNGGTLSGTTCVR